MRCRETGPALVELELGLLGPRAEAALRAHLESCPRCAAEARAEALLSDALRSLREPYPHEIEVRAAVSRRLRAAAPPEREEVPARQLGWAAAVATVCLAGLLFGLRLLLPELPPLLEPAASVAATLGGVLEGLGRVLLALLALPFKFFGVLFGILGALGSLLAKLEPAAIAAVAAGYAGIATTATLVLGRDLRRPQLAPRGKEHQR